MNQADILAEKVLDDILEETVLEMQRWVLLCELALENHNAQCLIWFFFFFIYRLEVEDEAETQADTLRNSSTLENILQRLQSFEVMRELYVKTKSRTNILKPLEKCSFFLTMVTHTDADKHSNTQWQNKLLMNKCCFQKIEEEIRQHWVHVKYADVEKSSSGEPIVGTYASVYVVR